MFEVRQKKKAGQAEKRDHITGIPVQMKAYAENLYGSSLDNVRVHYQSEKPRQFHALGYTQGSNVYLGPGQEKHLMHELCHVIQQKKGVVKPTSTEGGHTINDSVSLEKEAEVLEQQYEKEAPVQMLREASKQFSSTMGRSGPKSEQAFKRSVLGYYVLRYKKEVLQEDAVWSFKPPYTGANLNTGSTLDLASKSGTVYPLSNTNLGQKVNTTGDHAEDAICDVVECMELTNYIARLNNHPEKYILRNASLEVKLSSSPCKQCLSRLEEIADKTGLNIDVVCADQYYGHKGGGAGDISGLNGKNNLKIKVLDDPVEKNNLIQF